MGNLYFTLVVIACLSAATIFIAYQSINKMSSFTIYKAPCEMDMCKKNNGPLNAPTSKHSESSLLNTSPKQINRPEQRTQERNNEIGNNEVEKEFVKHWFRMQKQRVDWKQILAPCANNTVVGRTLPGWGKENATSLEKSYVQYMDIRPAGQFSRFFIRTKTNDGRYKVFGGDFWKVILFGPATVAATVFDHGNGSYEAIALIADPGRYSVVAIVERTLCEGMLDPTAEFFTRLMYKIKMNDARQKDMEHEPGCCLNGRLPQIEIDVVPSKDSLVNRIKAVLQSNCSMSCPFIWTGLGRFIKREWRPFLPSDYHKISTLSTTKAEGILFLYGDSVHTHFSQDYLKLRTDYNICSTVFSRCVVDSLKIYPRKSKLHPHGFTFHGYNEMKNYGNVTEEFKTKLIIDSIKEVFRVPGMQSQKSVLLINLLLQYVPQITFAQYKNLIRNVTYLLKNRGILFGSKARVVWRTGTALNYREITHKGWGSKFFTSAVSIAR